MCCIDVAYACSHKEYMVLAPALTPEWERGLHISSSHTGIVKLCSINTATAPWLQRTQDCAFILRNQYYCLMILLYSLFSAISKMSSNLI